eukprot:457772-Amphidinium_carterae.1
MDQHVHAELQHRHFLPVPKRQCTDATTERRKTVNRSIATLSGPFLKMHKAIVKPRSWDTFTAECLWGLMLQKRLVN